MISSSSNGTELNNLLVASRPVANFYWSDSSSFSIVGTGLTLAGSIGSKVVNAVVDNVMSLAP